MTARTPKPRQPARLGLAGAAVWKRLLAQYVFDTWEIPVVEAVCRQADDVAALELAIRRDGVLTTGSKGQKRLSPLVTEARLGRAALVRLLGQLNLPADVVAGMPPATAQTASQRRAQKAAAARWAGHEKRSRGKGADDGATA